MSGYPFKIYNASAGSGKTHTLTKEYLKIVLTTPNSFGQILAITFTNKAVNEMKHRILNSLYEFSTANSNEAPSPLFRDLMTDLDLDYSSFQQKSKKTLKDILHNYGYFDISTIDKFTHRLIRTFAKDLKLTQNFEVVLDTDLLLREAIDKLLEKVGHDKKLTKVLMDFALEKIGEDKSWDITFDLNKIGKLLFNETNSEHLKLLKDKGIDDFLELKKILKNRIDEHKKVLIENASKALKLIRDNALVTEDFRAGYFPKFMMQIESGNLGFDFGAAWKQGFHTAPLYTKSCPADIKALLDNLHPQFIEIFNEIKNRFYQTLFLLNIHKNLVPLTVLNAIQKEVRTIQLEKGQLSISEFNTIISNEIKNQPAPFIYERLGEKYRHYFIDEFQDTSELQWNNLVPLIANALESEDSQGKSGSLFLVGDAKQAIYRWRGGKAEQFLNLVNEKTNPFVVAPETHNLPSNYRSHEEVIKFNNDFFKITSPLLSNQLYHNLFEKGNHQKYNSKKGGFVQLTFLDKEKDVDLNQLYCEEVLKTIHVIQEKDYKFNDIAILVRDNKHGMVLADFLSEKRIPVISPDSLLISNSQKVKFLINLLHFSSHRDDLDTAYNLLYYLADNQTNKHSFINSHLIDLDAFLKERYHFNISFIKQNSVFDSLELAIKQFDLIDVSDAYITFLMDIVLEVEQKEGAGVHTFLSYWEKKKEKHSITAPNDLNAIQIMSIHKSKGLEFPIVIFPYANSNIYKEIDPKLWLSVDKSNFNGFEEVLISKKKEVMDYNEVASFAFEEEHHKLELDAFNILYVALTRAVNSLFIISEKDITSKGDIKMDYYSGLFIRFLKQKNLWNDSILTYNFGHLGTNPVVTKKSNEEKNIPYQYSNKESPKFKIMAKAGLLWDTEKETALLRGNLMHYIMGLIKCEEDIQSVFIDLQLKGIIEDIDEAPLIGKVFEIIQHSNLKEYFTKGIMVRNEQEIITQRGEILRPDRIVLQKNNATIIDYKTGKENASYKNQLNQYAQALESMGYHVANKIIVYINKEVTTEYV